MLLYQSSTNRSLFPLGILLILLLSGTELIYAQNKLTYFTGGIEMGFGISTVIDFRETNNKIEIPYFTFHGGFFTSRYISQQAYVEFGIFGSRCGNAYTKEFCKNGACSIEMITLNLYYLEFPITYYREISKLIGWTSFFFIGLDNGLHFESNMKGPSFIAEIPRNYFRDHTLSVSTGLAYEKANIRLRLHTKLALKSVIRPIFQSSVPVITNDYGGRIFPCELLVSCGIFFQ